MVSRRQESPETLANAASTSPNTVLPSPTATTTVLIPEPSRQSIQALINDPPPPYPLPGHRNRTRGTNNRSSNTETRTNTNRISVRSQQLSSDEETPLLGSENRRARRRSISHGSIISAVSAAPSLAQTVASLFQTEYDSDYEADGDDEGGDDDEVHGNGVGGRNASGLGRRVPSEDTLTSSSDDEHHHHQPTRTHDGRQYTQLPHFTVQDHEDEEQQMPSKYRRTAFSPAFWKRYYRPLVRKRYWQSFFHLAMINFPFALVAWLYLFIFTLTGTALLITLPIGAILCFLNAFGARTFARGELYLQTKLHRSSTSFPYHPSQYTLFTRLRPPTSAEIENGLAVTGEMVTEQSFYRNSYAMFADPTTYQSLFYFLVIKPPITLTLFLLSLGVFVPMLVLAPLTGPLALRAARRLGRWQAGVAVDGLLSRRV